MHHPEIIDETAQILKEYLCSEQYHDFLLYKSPDELAKTLKLDEYKDGTDWPQIFWWVKKYLSYSARTNHPGFVNRMWCGANLPSMIAEMVTAAANTSSCTFESAPVSTLMEKYMLQQMLDLVGFKRGEGQMTTGSSNANMLAMMAARNEALPRVKNEGMGKQKQIYGFVSADAHYSMEKAANILGLGIDYLVKVPVNDRGEMSIEALEKHLREKAKTGGIPFFVAGTAGTTVRGAYDSIEGLLKLRERYKFWLHIDGAWGGAVIVSDILRQKFMTGLHRVDSLTWDFHKMLGTSLMCNVFLINDKPHTLGRVCSGGDESYIFHDDTENEVFDLGAVSLQCGRRVDSLKWFLDWKYFGQKEFGRRVEHSYELCSYAETLIHESEHLELVLPRNSFNICFRYKASINVVNDLNLAIRNSLYQSGTSLVGYAYHDGQLFLRLLLANHELTTDDIDRYFEQIIEKGYTLEGDF